MLELSLLHMTRYCTPGLTNALRRRDEDGAGPPADLARQCFSWSHRHRRQHRQCVSLSSPTAPTLGCMQE